jgi:hypothetical protein
MAEGIKHIFVSPKANRADTTLVRPSNWNEKHTYEGEGARVYNDFDPDGYLALENEEDTIIPFTLEHYDTDVIHDNSTNNTRLTCKTAGKYLIIANLYLDVQDVAYFYISILLSGVTEIASFLSRENPSEITISTIWDLAVDDYVELTIYAEGVSFRHLYYIPFHSPEFMMQRIG